MIDEFQFDDRARDLYKSQQALAKRDNVKLPFTRDQFTLWLWRAMGGGSGPNADALKAQMCPYGCNRPIDILSVSIDHRIPRAQGGSYALDNLLPCCKDCNVLKGNMTEDGFRMLMEIGRKMGARDWQCIQESIRNGAHAKHDRWRRLKAEKALQKSGRPTPAYRPPAGTLDFDNDPHF